MKINKMLVLFSWLSVLSISFGFTANRTDWSIVPQLDPMPKTQAAEVLMKGGGVKAIDDARKTSDEKKSLEQENVTKAESPLRKIRNALADVKNNSERQPDVGVELISEPKLKSTWQGKIADVPANKNDPLNVILLMINGFDQGNDYLGMNLERMDLFTMKGLTRTCNMHPNIYINGDINYLCNCDELLKSNIVSLLSWAYNVRDMSTSALYDMPTIYTRSIEMDGLSILRPQERKIDRQLHETWQLHNEEKRKHSELSTSPIVHIETKESHEHKASELQHISDVLTRVREAFFRTLLSSLSSSGPKPKELSNRHHSGSVHMSLPSVVSNFYQLVEQTLEELESIPNEKPYLLVATTGADELNGALELLRRYVSSSRTLIVLTGTCPDDLTNVVPIFARGPGSKRLGKITSLQELPDTLRTIITEHSNNCNGGTDNCINAHEDSSGGISMYEEMEMPVRQRPQRQLDQDTKGSEKESKEKIQEIENIKKPEEAKTEKITEKRDENSKPNEIPLANVEIQLRMGDDIAKNNAQDISLPSTIICTAIVTLTTTRMLKF